MASVGLKSQPGLEKRETLRILSLLCGFHERLFEWAAAAGYPRLSPALALTHLSVCLILAHLDALGLAQSSPCSVSPLPLPSLAVFSLSCTLEGPKAEWRSR